ncbi:Cysteine-rich secretory protein family protein [Fibrobacter sp. UWH9]|uniref:CAP domain-containing protein n=1 Tax=Fibrobacter sp. UWH9 TaxID=1896213 RepID=UPI000918252B|nr:CAP domain-containing protein [Fibrobacter sp. UWH9]SHG82941.1 Cysteine-rich secretory protein family protein [Fibrobacter sp. UWH9]
MFKLFPIFTVSAALMFVACGDDSSSVSVQDETSSCSNYQSAETSSSSPKEDGNISASSSSNNGSSATPASSESTTVPASSETAEASDWRSYCLDVINKYRATEGLTSLVLAPEAKQTCVEEQAAADLKANSAHGHFGDCGEFAQNSGPNISLSWMGTEEKIVDYYLEMMWNEKKLVESGQRDPNKSEDYSYIGHYLNMSSTKYSSVACGIAKSSDGKTGWFNVNFHK